ncbi:Ccdc146, partial [Symbiodinium sp. KB8]
APGSAPAGLVPIRQFDLGLCEAGGHPWIEMVELIFEDVSPRLEIMAELNEEIKDLEKSAAYNILDELYRFENEQSFVTRAKQLNQQEKIKLEKTTLESQEDQNCIEQLMHTKFEKEQEYQVAQDREMMLQSLGLPRKSPEEIENGQGRGEEQLKEREMERLAEAEPKLRKAREEIEVVNKETEVLKGQKERHQEKLEEYNARIKEVETEAENNRDIYKVYESEHNKIKDDPERIRKQAEKFENAVRALQEAQKEKVAAIEGANEQAREINREAKELDESRAKKQMRLQLMTESSKITDQSCEDTKKKLDKESAVHQELALKRAKIDKELEELNAHNRHAQQEVTTLQKQLERMKRRYRQTLSHKDSVAETLPPLEVTKKDLEKSTKLQEEDIRRQRRLLEDIQAEVDLFIGAFLKQESLEKDKKEEFDTICHQMEEMQKELKDLKVEEQHWSQHFKTLASHREKLARDASQAHRLCRETADEVAMKELEEQDLKKKHQEISQKQKEFCTMYEVVKNERNKYMTHIQKSDQHLSEMKEKFKILSNEVEILRMESAYKDKQLARIRQEEQRLQVIHDQLQNEKTRITAKGTALNEQVEQFVIEIDKLNSIISAIEKEMEMPAKQGINVAAILGSDKQLAEWCPGINVILGGHDHVPDHFDGCSAPFSAALRQVVDKWQASKTDQEEEEVLCMIGDVELSSRTNELRTRENAFGCLVADAMRWTYREQGKVGFMY